MSYVVYHKGSTRYLFRDSIGMGKRFATTGAAKGALTRAVKADPELDRDDYAIAEYGDFVSGIEKKVLRINLMSRNEYWEPINTPVFLSPAYETYWSM